MDVILYSSVIVAFDGIEEKNSTNIVSKLLLGEKRIFFLTFIFCFRFLSLTLVVFGFFVYFQILLTFMTVEFFFFCTSYFTINLHVGFCSDINRIEISKMSSNLFQTGFYTEYLENDSNIFFLIIL